MPAAQVPPGDSVTRQPRRIFVGAIVNPKSKTELQLIEHAVLGVCSKGKIRFLEDLDQAVNDTQTGSDQATETASAFSSLSPQHQTRLASILEAHKFEPAQCATVVLPYGQFLCPGFIDTHTHACQVPNVGLGQQYELLDWLHNVTFPRERRFADVEYAERTYNSVVQRMIDCGTTTACYFATHHLEASKVLARVCTERGQRAFVGKCNMDRNAAPDYEEASAEESLHDTREFLSYCRSLHESTQINGDDAIQAVSKAIDTGKIPSPPGASGLSPTHRSPQDQLSPIAKSAATALQKDSALVQPILTPRFAISCTDALLTGVSAIFAKDPTLRLQTHLSESPGEIAFTKELFPFAQTYTDVYDHFNLLRDTTVLAHAIHLDDSELRLIEKRQCGVSHCPNSNLNLRSGATRLGEMLNRGIKVSLGTDVSGGFGLGMLTAVRDASIVAKVLQFAARDGLSPSVGPRSIDQLSISGGGGGAGGGAFSPMEIGKAYIDAPDGPYKRPPLPEVDFTKGPLLPATLFWVATVGGAEVASVADRTGSLEVGKDFDALLVRMYEAESEQEQSELSGGGGGGTTTTTSRYPYTGNPSCYVEEGEPLASLVEKFLFTADDRNIASVWVRSRLIGGADFRAHHRV